jgi:hypothetical protein
LNDRRALQRKFQDVVISIHRPGGTFCREIAVPTSIYLMYSSSTGGADRLLGEGCVRCLELMSSAIVSVW